MNVRRLIILLAFVCLTAATQAQRNQFVIPVAGDAAGRNGTHFRSDITITNLRNEPQPVALQWMPSGDTGNAVPAKLVTIAANSSVTSENFVNEYLQQTGVGSILIRAVSQSSDPDVHGDLYVTSRIWTPQPESDGTTSQSMPAVRLQDIAHEHVVFTGHRTSEAYRVNAGVVNLDTSIDQTFEIHVTGSVPVINPVIYRVSVKPRSMAMIAVDWPEDPLMRIDVKVLPQTGGGRGTLWVPFVSSVDNRTGDSWSTMGAETGE